MSDKTIKISKNGPLIVKNVKKLIDGNGNSLDILDTMVLCRCGKSKQKPFCDGSHNDGFDDKKAENRCRDSVDVYKGERITVYDNRGVCSHHRYCVEKLPSVFRRGERKWIHPDEAEPDEIIKICEICPSGALSYGFEGQKRINKGVSEEDKITIAEEKIHGENGPYEVNGAIKLNIDDGEMPESEKHYTLCRCGKSKNKPFCDGTHLKHK
jgi:CDGSH-type Zn-finger protein